MKNLESKALTAEAVIKYLRGELTDGNSIVTASHGQGGAGLDISDGEAAESIIEELESMEFIGEVAEPCSDLDDYLEPGCKVYEFEELSGEGNPLKTQVIIYA